MNKKERRNFNSREIEENNNNNDIPIKHRKILFLKVWYLRVEGEGQNIMDDGYAHRKMGWR